MSKISISSDSDSDMDCFIVDDNLPTEGALLDCLTCKRPKVENDSTTCINSPFITNNPTEKQDELVLKNTSTPLSLFSTDLNKLTEPHTPAKVMIVSKNDINSDSNSRSVNAEYSVPAISHKTNGSSTKPHENMSTSEANLSYVRGNPLTFSVDGIVEAHNVSKQLFTRTYVLRSCNTNHSTLMTNTYEASCFDSSKTSQAEIRRANSILGRSHRSQHKVSESISESSFVSLKNETQPGSNSDDNVLIKEECKTRWYSLPRQDTQVPVAGSESASDRCQQGKETYNPDEYGGTADIENSGYSCHICGKSFLFTAALYRHLFVQHDENYFRGKFFVKPRNEIPRVKSSKKRKVKSTRRRWKSKSSSHSSQREGCVSLSPVQTTPRPAQEVTQIKPESPTINQIQPRNEHCTPFDHERKHKPVDSKSSADSEVAFREPLVSSNESMSCDTHPRNEHFEPFDQEYQPSESRSLAESEVAFRKDLVSSNESMSCDTHPRREHSEPFDQEYQPSESRSSADAEAASGEDLTALNESMSNDTHQESNQIQPRSQYFLSLTQKRQPTLSKSSDLADHYDDVSNSYTTTSNGPISNAIRQKPAKVEKSTVLVKDTEIMGNFSPVSKTITNATKRYTISSNDPISKSISQTPTEVKTSTVVMKDTEVMGNSSPVSKTIANVNNGALELKTVLSDCPVDSAELNVVQPMTVTQKLKHILSKSSDHNDDVSRSYLVASNDPISNVIIQKPSQPYKPTNVTQNTSSRVFRKSKYDVPKSHLIASNDPTANAVSQKPSPPYKPTNATQNTSSRVFRKSKYDVPKSYLIASNDPTANAVSQNPSQSYKPTNVTQITPSRVFRKSKYDVPKSYTIASNDPTANAVSQKPCQSFKHTNITQNPEIQSTSSPVFKKSKYDVPILKQMLTQCSMEPNGMKLVQPAPVNKKENSIRVFPFKCEICNKEFLSVTDYHLHHDGKHKTEGSFLCGFCDKGFDTHLDLRCHLMCHSDKYESTGFTCTHCHFMFEKESDLVDHLEFHRSVKNCRNYCKCPACDSRRDSEIEYVFHMVTHIGEPRGICKCGICHRHFPEVNDLEVHLRMHHFKSEEFLFVCSTCGFQFPSSAHLQQHERVHQTLHELKTKDVFRWSCRLCHDSFEYKNQMFDHEFIMHPNTRKYPCDFCRTVCFTKKEFEAHLDTHEVVLKKML